MEQAKWVPVTKMPHVGETVSIRFDPDEVDDWAWGDAAMYAPPSAAVQPTAVQPAAPGMPPPMQGAGPVPASGDPMVEFIQSASGPWGQMPGFKGMIEAAIAAGNVSFEQSSQVIDAGGNPQLREQILGALKAQGIDVEAMQAGGMAIAGPGAQPAIPSPGTSSTEDPSERLRKLDELLAQGVVSADEHRKMRQKIIDSI
jgi:hypothetical protein